MFFFSSLLSKGWISQGRNASTPPTSNCTDIECSPTFDDSGWQTVDIPHDFVVEGVFNQSAVRSGLEKKHTNKGSEKREASERVREERAKE